MNDSPKVSVLLSVYNGASFLNEAVNSILQQTYSNFEMLVIDDGSTDNTLEILQGYSDPRLRLFHNERNMGLVYSLNRGLAEAHGDYIARMDADDISLPDRFAKQVDFLDKHPQIGVIGGWYQWISENGDPGKVIHFPSSNGVIQWHLLVQVPPLAHPLVMIRSKAIKDINGYAFVAHAEDYDLWRRISANWELYNLPMVLLRRREHDKRIGRVYSGDQLINAALVRQKLIRNILGEEIPLAFIAESLPLREHYEHDLLILEFLDQLYRKFTSTYPLKKEEQEEIRRRVSRKIMNLALQNPRQREKYILKAFILDPRQIRSIVSVILNPRLKLKNLKRWISAKRYSINKNSYKFGIYAKSFWDSRASNVDNLYGSSIHDFDLLKKIILSTEAKRILDVGCGSGRLFPLYELLDVQEVVGQDISKQALCLSQNRYKTLNVSLLNCPISKLDFTERYFDISICNRVLQHIPTNAIDLVIAKISTLSKFVYINELSAIDCKASLDYYMFLHDYIQLFSKHGFTQINEGILINEANKPQKWILFRSNHLEKSSPE